MSSRGYSADFITDRTYELTHESGPSAYSMRNITGAGLPLRCVGISLAPDARASRPQETWLLVMKGKIAGQAAWSLPRSAFKAQHRISVRRKDDRRSRSGPAPQREGL